MAKSLGEFFYDLAKKAGVSEDNESLKAFIQDKDLFNKPLAEDLQTGIDNSLISIKDATNNHPKIKSTYYAAFMDGIDKVIDPLLTDFDEDAKTEIKSEANTFKRIPLLFTKIKELEGKKHAAPGKDKDGFQKQIDDLHSQLKTEKENSVNQKKLYDSDLVKFRIENKLDALTGTYKTIYDDLDPEVKSMTIKALINKNLQDNKAQFSFDENNNFTLLKEGGIYYGDNHQQVEPKGFIEQILSRNKLLKVSDQSTNNTPVNRNSQQPPQGGSGNNSRNTTLSGLAQQALKDLENSSAVTIMG